MAIWMRNRMLVLVVAVILLGILSYVSFDTYIRPSSVPIPLEEEFYSIGSPANTTTDTSAPNVLLVSAFFPLSKSKHTMWDYSSWLSRFLKPIETDMYFFAPPEMESMIRELRGSLPITINTSFTSPFDIPPLSGLQEKYTEMHEQDREKNRHSPELYAVWGGKPYFLDEAVKNLRNAGKNYDYAFWTDAGSFRDDHHYVTWPDARRVDRLWEEGSRLTGTKKEELLFFPMWDAPHSSMRYWREDMGPVDNEFSEGSFFGGSPQTVRWWRDLYYAYHDAYLAQHIFVGKDQTLINALFLLNPSRVITVWLRDSHAPAHRGLIPLVDEGYLGSCGPSWFYYQFFLARERERTLMRQKWDAGARWNWDWWKKRETCRMTRLLDMEGVLKRQFGKGWTPPPASIGG